MDGHLGKGRLYVLVKGILFDSSTSFLMHCLHLGFPARLQQASSRQTRDWHTSSSIVCLPGKVAPQRRASLLPYPPKINLHADMVSPDPYARVEGSQTACFALLRSLAPQTAAPDLHAPMHRTPPLTHRTTTPRWV